MTIFRTFTEDECAALRLHRLVASKPSQLSDAFVLGMRYAVEQQSAAAAAVPPPALPGVAHVSQACDSSSVANQKAGGVGDNTAVAWYRKFNGQRMGVSFERTKGTLLPGWTEHPLVEPPGVQEVPRD